MNTDFDQLIRTAIAQRCLLKFMYDRHARLAEPHDYGIHKGVRKLLCYQVDGGSGSGKIPDWRSFMVDRMADIALTDIGFGGSRPVDGRHIEWDELFASVSRRAGMIRASGKHK